MTVWHWYRTTLPGTFGHPCEALSRGNLTVRVWQASKRTARGAWCWRLDSKDAVHVTRGNRGIAKSAARRALAAEVLTQR